MKNCLPCMNNIPQRIEKMNVFMFPAFFKRLLVEAESDETYGYYCTVNFKELI